MFIPVIALIRLVSPVILIRFGFLSTSFGHMVLGCELYLARKFHGMEPQRRVDLFLADTRHSNAFVVGMLGRKMTIMWRPLIRVLIRANELVPGKSRHLVNLNEYMDPNDLLARTPPQLIFTDEETKRGDEALRAIGLEPDKPFVCLHVRDASFKFATRAGYRPETNDYRNADIEKYLEATRSLVARGYSVVRMGAVVETELPTEIEGVIDYARSGMRSDFTDAVLSESCTFWLGTPSGANVVAVVRRRPVVFTDCIPIGVVASWGEGNLYIPKKLKKPSGRFLTLWEMLHGEIGWPEIRDGEWSHTLDMYEDRGLTIVDNSSSEIRSVVEEMDDQLRGKVTSRDDREDQIQVEVARLLEASRWHGKARARLGSGFINSNPELVSPY